MCHDVCNMKTYDITSKANSNKILQNDMKSLVSMSWEII